MGKEESDLTTNLAFGLGGGGKFHVARALDCER